ncbi:Hsp20/alpha crystallin family protein [Pseudactinotalea sp. Z1732]|uniref:Hsp20/alpha crystallin family protein n=1 Tax=Micrococcales TaxID=85006 RepID=UPI003C7EAE84
MATRIDPFREMDRVFSNALGQVMSSGRSNAMPIDLYRDGDKFVLNMDLPGVDPSSIDVDVEDQTLTIRAERGQAENQQTQWLARERPTGTFARQLMLGSGVSVDRIDASYADGVLSLTIPVAEEAKPRKIEVAHSSNQSRIEQAG